MKTRRLNRRLGYRAAGFSLLLLGLWAQSAFGQAGSVLIRGDGVGKFRIGSGLPKPGQGEVVFDRVLIDEQGRRARVLGVVVAGQVVKVEVDRGRIWRMTISEPGLKTRDGVEVGSPVARLASQAPVKAEVGSGADLILLPLDQCGIAYWSNLDLGPDGLGKKWDTPSLALLPDSVTVRTILVTGSCSK